MVDNKSNEEYTFIWKNIYYEVKIQNKKDKKMMPKIIINNISGYAKSKQVTAIMGPSGCGKSSLLNFLTDRIQYPPGAVYSGETYLNSDKVNLPKIAEVSSYVMQDDLLFDILTPKETLLFVAKLRSKKTEEEYEKQVNDLLEELKLTKCKDTVIGNELRKGISGGERKRTSIGVEIISNPSIMFLDEPTSGLDSQTSLIVIDYLKELARNHNKAIVFTIHQPSSNIVSLFDRLLLLNKGELIYQGPTLKVIEYFNQIGLPLSNKANPADAFMHKLEEQNAIIEKEEKEIKVAIIGKEEHEPTLSANKNSKPLSQFYKELINDKIESEMDAFIKEGKPNNVRNKNMEARGFFSEFLILSQRAFKNVIRNPMLLRVRIMMVLVFSFIACSIFYHLGNDLIGVSNKIGFFFFFTINNFMTLLFGSVLAFPMERGVFLREYSNKLYGVLPYYLSKNLIETPPGLLGTFLFGVIVYYIINLRGPPQFFFTFLLVYVCLAWLAQSMGLCFGASFSNINTAMIITQFSVLPTFLFSGVLINQQNMPAWLAWLRFFSPFRYAVEAGLRNEFDGNTAAAFNPVTALNLDIGMWECIYIMVLFGLGLRILGFFFIKLLVRKVG